MEGYGLKIRREDNHNFKGIFKNDNLIADGQNKSDYNNKFEFKEFTISSFA